MKVNLECKFHQSPKKKGGRNVRQRQPPIVSLWGGAGESLDKGDNLRGEKAKHYTDKGGERGQTNSKNCFDKKGILTTPTTWGPNGSCRPCRLRPAQQAESIQHKVWENIHTKCEKGPPHLHKRPKEEKFEEKNRSKQEIRQKEGKHTVSQKRGTYAESRKKS